MDSNLEMMKGASKFVASRENNLMWGCDSVEPFSKHINIYYCFSHNVSVRGGRAETVITISQMKK